MIVKPCHYAINIVYSCPYCSRKHRLSLKDAKADQNIVICDCGEAWVSQRIHDTKLTVVTRDEHLFNNSIREKVSVVLRGMGFQKNEYSSILESVSGKDESDLLMKVLSKLELKNDAQ